MTVTVTVTVMAQYQQQQQQQQYIFVYLKNGCSSSIKVQKIRHSSSIIRYHDIKPSNIKEIREKRHKCDQEMAIVDPYMYYYGSCGYEVDVTKNLFHCIVHKKKVREKCAAPRNQQHRYIHCILPMVGSIVFLLECHIQIFVIIYNSWVQLFFSLISILRKVSNWERS